MPVSNLATENYERYAHHRDRGHVEFITKDTLCSAFYAGQQWDEKIKRKLERQGRPALTINKVLATLATVQGEQLHNRADVSFLPFKNGNEETAEALNKVHLQILQANAYRWIEAEMFADAIIGSRGFTDCRISFKDNMMGEVELSLLNPRNVVIDSEATSYDPADWKEVFLTKWLTCDEVELLYGKANAQLLRTRDASSLDFGYDSIDAVEESFGGGYSKNFGDDKYRIKRVRVIERQFKELNKVRTLVDMQTGEMRTIPSNWDEERVGLILQQYPVTMIERVAEQIRWRVSADDVLLFDEVSPLRYFTVVPYFPYFRRGKTIGLAETLVGPQEILNKTISQELHVLNSSANGGWKIKANSLKNMDLEELEKRGAQTGLIMELDDIANAEKIQPNQIPTGLDRFGFKIDEFIKEISGVGDSMRGFDREDVAARAIQAKQAAGSVNLTKPFENLVRTRQMLAVRILNLVQTFYTEQRMMQITSEGARQETETLVVNEVTPEGRVVNDLTVGEYQVVVTSVPTRESYMASQYEQALAMREQGVMIPDQYLVESSTLAKKTEILEAMKNDAGAQRAEAKADLELQQLQAEVQATQMDSQKKQADTQLSSARAQQTLVEAQNPQGGPSPEQQMAELELERYKIDQELQMQRWKLEQEFALKREQMQQEMLMKRAESEMKMEMQEKQAQMQMQMQGQQAQAQMELEAEGRSEENEMADRQFQMKTALDHDLATKQSEMQNKQVEKKTALGHEVAKAKLKNQSQAPKPR